MRPWVAAGTARVKKMNLNEIKEKAGTEPAFSSFCPLVFSLSVYFGTSVKQPLLPGSFCNSNYDGVPMCGC